MTLPRVRRNSKQRAIGRVTTGGGVNRDGGDLWAHGYGRAAMQRMMRIHRKIEDREYPNRTKMSAEFEVSVRTLKRDIEFMKDWLKMPIEFDALRNGYFFTRSVPHFPRVPLTEKEIVGLFVAQKTIAQYEGTSLQPVLDSTFRKMCASAPGCAGWRDGIFPSKSAQISAKYFYRFGFSQRLVCREALEI